MSTEGFGPAPTNEEMIAGFKRLVDFAPVFFALGFSYTLLGHWLFAYWLAHLLPVYAGALFFRRMDALRALGAAGASFAIPCLKRALAGLGAALTRALTLSSGEKSALAPAMPAFALASAPLNPPRTPPVLTRGFSALRNIWQFVSGCVAFVGRNPKLCIGLLLLALFFIFGPPSCARLPFGESRDAAIARADQQEAENRVKTIELQRNETIHEIANKVAVNREQINAISARGQDEIERATPENETPIDADLVASWRNALSQLCIYANPDGDLPDSCG